MKLRPFLLDLIASSGAELDPTSDSIFLQLEQFPNDNRPASPVNSIQALPSPATVGVRPLIPPIMTSKRTRLEVGEDQHGSIFSISGPVIVAENMIGCAMYELVGVVTPL